VVVYNLELVQTLLEEVVTVFKFEFSARVSSFYFLV